MSFNRATVKSVLSADKVVLSGRPRADGPPLLRTLGLNFVQARKLGNKEKADEVIEKLLPID
jgi:staphylococcal nuclease domain-containing protein 1